MNKTRRIVVASLGAMTPALIATDQVQARATEGPAITPVQSGAPTIAVEQGALKSALLALSPAEKMRIAGDRIRLAKSNAPSSQKTVRATMCATTCCIVTKNCGGSGQRPPRQAR